MNTLLVAIMASFGLIFSQGALSQNNQNEIQSLQTPAFSLRNLPERPADAVTGSSFLKLIDSLQGHEREKAVVSEILKGNFPDFLRNLSTVKFSKKDGQGRQLQLTTYVMPDYLAVGSNEDFIRFPMNLFSANEIAQAFGFMLPTRKIVNKIYQTAEVKLKPYTLPPSRAMTSTAYFKKHDEAIESQLQTVSTNHGMLVAGHKKDVVQTRKLLEKPSAIAIFGWHRKSTGKPIQPLSTVHGASYVDYSHGIRMVSQWAYLEINGIIELVNLKDLLTDRHDSQLISDEGPIGQPNKVALSI